jgi:hypothetical protein
VKRGVVVVVVDDVPVHTRVMLFHNIFVDSQYFFSCSSHDVIEAVGLSAEAAEVVVEGE